MWFTVIINPSSLLVRDISLNQPGSYPMRRLVITGKDTPENFRILFGTDQLDKLHKEQRRDVLLMHAQQHGSPAAKMSGFYDEGCPGFTPRPSSAAEEEELL